MASKRPSNKNTSSKNSASAPAAPQPRTVNGFEIVPVDAADLKKRVGNDRFAEFVEPIKTLRDGEAMRVDRPNDMKFDSFRANLAGYIRKRGISAETGLTYSVRTGSGDFAYIVAKSPEAEPATSK